MSAIFLKKLKKIQPIEQIGLNIESDLNLSLTEAIQINNDL